MSGAKCFSSACREIFAGGSVPRCYLFHGNRARAVLSVKSCEIKVKNVKQMALTSAAAMSS